MKAYKTADSSTSAARAAIDNFVVPEPEYNVICGLESVRMMATVAKHCKNW